jgi:CheY-like chemotaxis protein
VEFRRRSSRAATETAIQRQAARFYAPAFVGYATFHRKILAILIRSKLYVRSVVCIVASVSIPAPSMLPALSRDIVSQPYFPRVGLPSQAWPTLLVVDPDQDMARALVCFFEKKGYHVAAAGSISEAKMLFHRRKSWKLVIADFHLPDGTGTELETWIQEQMQNTPVLLMSGSPHCSTLCAGSDYLSKPFPPERLESYLQTFAARS